jgi:hypothetical protein
MVSPVHRKETPKISGQNLQSLSSFNKAQNLLGLQKILDEDMQDLGSLIPKRKQEEYRQLLQGDFNQPYFSS